MTFLDHPVIETRDAVAKGDGDHLVFKDEHGEVYAEVLDGKVVGYHGKDRVKGIHFHEMDPSSDIHAQRPVRCWECFLDYCYPVRC
jgi:hypothetical protein